MSETNLQLSALLSVCYNAVREIPVTCKQIAYKLVELVGLEKTPTDDALLPQSYIS